MSDQFPDERWNGVDEWSEWRRKKGEEFIGSSLGCGVQRTPSYPAGLLLKKYDSLFDLTNNPSPSSRLH
jgi:hypothetical protein